MSLSFDEASLSVSFCFVPQVVTKLTESCCAGCKQSCCLHGSYGINLVDPASSHMLVSKIKPCMSQYKLLHGETANGSLKQLSFS